MKRQYRIAGQTAGGRCGGAVALVLVLAQVACSGAGEEPTEEELAWGDVAGEEYAGDEEIGEARSAILNGTSTPGSRSGVVRITGPYECTGTLLKNQWVLTAGHCAHLELDDTFAAAVKGVVPRPSDGSNDMAGTAVAIDSSGRTLLAGGIRASSWLYLRRFTPGGAPDVTFGPDGVVITDLPGSVSERIHDVAYQADGKLIAVGEALEGDKTRILVARFTANGALDPTYGSGGISIPDFADAAYAMAEALVIDSSGRAVVGGYVDGNLALVRLTTSGALDTSFSGDGKVRTSLSPFDNTRFLDLALDTSGRIVGLVEGWLTDVPNGYRAGLARYLANGELDPAFDGDGSLTIEPINPVNPPSGTDATGLLLQGTRVLVGGSQDGTAAVWRRNSNGSVDATFGVNGVARPRFADQLGSSVGQLAFAPDGRIRASARATLPDGPKPAFATLSANGSTTADRRFPSAHGFVVDTPMFEGGRPPEMASSGSRVVLADWVGKLIVLSPDRLESTTLTGRVATMGADTSGVDRAYIPSSTDNVALLHLTRGHVMNGSRTGYTFPGFVTTFSGLVNTNVTCRGYGETQPGGAGGPGLTIGTSRVTGVDTRHVFLAPASSKGPQLPLSLDAGAACTTAAGLFVGVHSYGNTSVATEVRASRFATWATGVIAAP